MYSQKHYGRLFYNYINDRMGIKFNDGVIEDGLHCGQMMELNINGKWVQTRIECDDDGNWYFVEMKNLVLFDGLCVRL